MTGPVERLELLPTNSPQLKIKSKKVSKWQGERLGMKLIKFIAANSLECLGLAAPQVGINKRVFVLFDGKEFAIFIYRRLLEVGALEEAKTEGCLSVPGQRYSIKRPISITVKDAVRTKPFELQGWVARAWLHELDHLNGVLINDIGDAVEEEAKPL